MQVNLPNHRRRYRYKLTVLLEVGEQDVWRMLVGRSSCVMYLCCSAWCSSRGLSPLWAQTEGVSDRRPPAPPPRPAIQKWDHSWCSQLDWRGKEGAQLTVSSWRDLYDVFSSLLWKIRLTAFELHRTRLAVHGEVFEIHGAGKSECQPGAQRQKHRNGTRMVCKMKRWHPHIASSLDTRLARSAEPTAPAISRCRVTQTLFTHSPYIKGHIEQLQPLRPPCPSVYSAVPHTNHTGRDWQMLTDNMSAFMEGLT